MIPVEDQTAKSYQPPGNTQFSVFLPNRVGRMLDVVQMFDTPYLTLAGMSVVDATDHAVVRLLTSNSQLARRVLDREELHFSETEVLAVEIESDKTLVALCRALLSVEVNIQYAYPLFVQPRGKPVVAIQTDDIIISGQILRRKLFTLLAENDLGDNASRNDPGNPNN